MMERWWGAVSEKDDALSSSSEDIPLVFIRALETQRPQIASWTLAYIYQFTELCAPNKWELAHKCNAVYVESGSFGMSVRAHAFMFTKVY